MRTDLHVVDGDLPHPKPALIPGTRSSAGSSPCGVSGFRAGQRVGVPWLGHTCGHCPFCLAQRENLCDAPRFTGYTRDGGYAEYAIADSRYCFALPGAYDDEHVAPLLCAGLIGYRTLRPAGEAARLGIYGFGAAAHVVAQIAVAQGREVFAFTRPGTGPRSSSRARPVAAGRAPAARRRPPSRMPPDLRTGRRAGAARPGRSGEGRHGGLRGHPHERPAGLPYRLLWEERRLLSVANLTRADGIDLMRLAAAIPLRTHTTLYPLEQANAALADLRDGRLAGAAVLDIGH